VEEVGEAAVVLEELDVAAVQEAEDAVAVVEELDVVVAVDVGIKYLETRVPVVVKPKYFPTDQHPAKEGK
jgi:hypothetical protein